MARLVFGTTGLYVPAGIGFEWGFGLGFVGGFGWGWHHWGFDWGHRNVIYNHSKKKHYISQQHHLYQP